MIPFWKVVKFIKAHVKDCVAYNLSKENTVKDVAAFLDDVFEFNWAYMEAHDREAFEYIIGEAWDLATKRKARHAARIQRKRDEILQNNPAVK